MIKSGRSLEVNKLDGPKDLFLQVGRSAILFNFEA